MKLESPRWSFVTKEIEGAFPNWHQCVPTTNSKWTVVLLSEEAVKQLIQVIPNLPGGDSPNYPVRLRIDRYLNVEGPNKDQDDWTSIPVQTVNVNGNPVSIGLNREYLLKALRFGLNKLEIEDPLTPIILTNGGKKIIISPLNLDAPKLTAPAQPTAEVATPSTNQPAALEPPGTPTQERKEDMPRTAKTTTLDGTRNDLLNAEGQQSNGSATSTTNNGNNGNGSAMKSLVDQVDQIKDSLKAVIRDLTTVIDTVKTAEKEKKATDKEIEAVRAKLRQIQNVSI